MLRRIRNPSPEAALLLFVTHGEPVLDQDGPAAHNHAFEFRTGAQELLVLVLGAEAHDRFDERPVVPRTIEKHDLARCGESADISLEPPLGLLAFGCGSEGLDTTNPRIQALGDSLDDSALACGVAPFEDHDDLEPLLLDVTLELHQFRLEPVEFLLVELVLQLRPLDALLRFDRVEYGSMWCCVGHGHTVDARWPAVDCGSPGSGSWELFSRSMNAPISFLSDFGHTDEFVGVVHGVIARIAPSTRILDITHGIGRGDIHGGAMALTRAVQYMPDGVFLAIVDPGVGTDRKAIAARTPVGHFVGPDNGVLAPAVAMVGGADLIVSLEESQFQLPGKGGTFAGRDIFGPAAAVLASDQAEIENLGPALDLGSINPLLIPLAEPAGNGAVRGSVLWVDTFGNIQFNVSPGDLGALEIKEGDDVLVSFNMEEFRIVWGSTYGDVQEGEAIIHVDSHGQIAIAVRGGRADEAFSFGVGDTVVLGRPDGGSRIPLQIAD